MKMKLIKNNGISVAVATSDEKVIVDVQSALDFIMSIQHEAQCNRIALNKEAVSEDFFILSTCLAGEILQKFINYHIKFAVFGDFTTYSSKPLKDFFMKAIKGMIYFFNQMKTMQ